MADSCIVTLRGTSNGSISRGDSKSDVLIPGVRDYLRRRSAFREKEGGPAARVVQYGVSTEYQHRHDRDYSDRYIS